MTQDVSSGVPMGRGRPLWPAVATVAAFATGPYLDIVAANLGQDLALLELAAWWGATMLGAIVLVLVADRSGQAHRVAVLVAAFIYLLFLYPEAATFQRNTLGIAHGGRPIGWLAVTMAVFAALIPLSRRHLVQVLAVSIGLALLIPPAWQITSRPSLPERLPTSTVSLEDGPAITPNIWLFLTDGYGRADAIKRQTGLDIGPWIATLKDRDFEVADEAMSNYAGTFLSVSSLLEMDYLATDGDRYRSTRPFHERIRGDNMTVETLRRWGYSYVHAYSGGLWDGARCAGAEDVCVGDAFLSETSLVVLRSTPLIRLVEGQLRAEVSRLSDPRHVVSEVLHNSPSEPRFVFAHLMSPHPPFTRNADCKLRRVPMVYTGLPSEYSQMVQCLNRQLSEAIDRILAEDPAALIIVQSDHGFDFASLNYHDPDDPSWETEPGLDRFRIFSSLRLPPGCDDVPEELAPVNTMRVVFGCLTGKHPTLLPYRRMNAGEHIVE